VSLRSNHPLSGRHHHIDPKAGNARIFWAVVAKNPMSREPHPQQDCTAQKRQKTESAT
jgi:hypothetical protein